MPQDRNPHGADTLTKPDRLQATRPRHQTGETSRAWRTQTTQNSLAISTSNSTPSRPKGDPPLIRTKSSKRPLSITSKFPNSTTTAHFGNSAPSTIRRKSQNLHHQSSKQAKTTTRLGRFFFTSTRLFQTWHCACVTE